VRRIATIMATTIERTAIWDVPQYNLSDVYGVILKDSDFDIFTA
jgi:hypothetical protein